MSDGARAMYVIIGPCTKMSAVISMKLSGVMESIKTTHDMRVGPSRPVQMHLLARCYSTVDGSRLTPDDASV